MLTSLTELFFQEPFACVGKIATGEGRGGREEKKKNISHQEERGGANFRKEKEG